MKISSAMYSGIGEIAPETPMKEVVTSKRWRAAPG